MTSKVDDDAVLVLSEASRMGLHVQVTFSIACRQNTLHEKNTPLEQSIANFER
jgi:hypothetical protein